MCRAARPRERGGNTRGTSAVLGCRPDRPDPQQIRGRSGTLRHADPPSHGGNPGSNPGSGIQNSLEIDKFSGSRGSQGTVQGTTAHSNRPPVGTRPLSKQRVSDEARGATLARNCPSTSPAIANPMAMLTSSRCSQLGRTKSTDPVSLRGVLIELAHSAIRLITR